MLTWFVSDLHLDPARPDAIQLAQRFFSNTAKGAEHVYILGDLFEYWLGDDNPKHGLEPVLEAFSALTQSGTKITFMHGNRDFLIGDQFASQYNIDLITDDEQVIDLYGTPTLIMHGDTLCTDDHDYLKFRTLVRDPTWQGNILSQTLEERIQFVGKLRKMSQGAMQEKSSDIMDANQAAVEEAMVRHRVSQLIHGHTHRPAVHTVPLPHQAGQRWVLGEWTDHAKVLRCSSTDMALITFR